MAQSSQVKNFNWWYDAYIDWMLANPDSKLSDAAAYFNCSMSWMSIVKNSDIFKERFNQRREQMNEMVHQTLVHRLERVAANGLEVLEERLSPAGQQRSRLKTEIIADVTDKALSRLGYGAPKAGGTVVNVNSIAAVDTGVRKDAILSARESIRQDQLNRTRAIEGEVVATQLPSPSEPSSAQLDLELFVEEKKVEIVDDLPPELRDLHNILMETT